MESNKASSRKLSPYQYFQILQVEWLSADLRCRIYPKKDKEYWNRVKEGKEKIINQIAEKNHLPTIFTDEEMKRIFESKMYGNEGFPTFSYKNETDKEKQEPLDLIYYFSKGAEVRLEHYGELKVGKIKSYQVFATNLIVTVEDADYSVEVAKVTRIL